MYDVNGNVVQTTISFTGMNSSIYQPVTLADGTTSTGSVITSYTYDPIFNVMTSETDADGHKTYEIYDSTYEQAETDQHVMTVNGVSLNLSQAPDGKSVRAQQFTGDDTGNLLATIDAVGNTTTYTYCG